MKPTLLGKWVFLLLPLLYLVLSFIFLSGIPHFYSTLSDPPYIYLLNGTNIASGHLNVGNILPPGTPVECFAAIVIFIKHLFTGNTILSQDVLMHPESYLFACSIALALLLSAVTYCAGVYVYRHSGSILLALLFQLSPLFYNNTVSMAVALSAESIITIGGVFFMAYLYINTIEHSQTTNRNIIFFGLFTALLLTTKIYCIAVILLVFFLIRQGKQRILYLVSAGAFSLLFLFPLYGQLRNWAGNIKGILIHTGPYGQGNSGILNTTLYTGNLIELFTTHYVFTAIYIFVIAAFLAALFGILKKKITSSGFIFQITGILLFFMLFTLLIIKQYKVSCPNPLAHTVFVITKFYYFILLITCFPLAIAVSYKIIYPLLPSQFLRIGAQKLQYGILGLFIILGIKQTYSACYEIRNTTSVSFEKTRSFIDGWKNIPLILICDGGQQVYVEPALLFGISFAGTLNMPRYFDFLKKIYPNTYLYDIAWRDALTFWDSETDISTILRKNNKALVYISGADSAQEETTLKRICSGTMQKDKGMYKKIYSSENKYESIYLIKADTLR